MQGHRRRGRESNYLLGTERGSYILTLYEKRVAPEDLPFFIALMDHLAHQGLACPTPVRAKDGGALRELCGRPAAIVTFLNGMWPRRIEPFHCAGLGAALARLHKAGAAFPMTRPNNLSLAGWRRLYEACADRADEVQAGLRRELVSELRFFEAGWPRDLPAGVIHADLFPDNVFFRGRELSGLIDFYFACTDILAYDLAICLNAWCFEPDGSFNVTKARLLIGNYRNGAAARPRGDGGAAGAGAGQRAAVPADPALRLAEPDRGRAGAAEGSPRIPAKSCASTAASPARPNTASMPENAPQVEIFTDGACSGNPGPGGWGAILRYGGPRRRCPAARRRPPTTAWS